MRGVNNGFIGLVLAGALSVNGCFSGEPSKKDMEDAVGGANLEKLACAPAQGAAGYVCDFRQIFQFAKGNPNGEFQPGPPQKGRFYKADGTWRFAPR